MSHSSVEYSLLKNPVSPLILPTSGGSEEKEDELEDVQEDELGNYDEDELEESHDKVEYGLFDKKRSWRKVRKPEKVRRELTQKALRQSKCEYTDLRTTLSGVGVLSWWLEEQ